MFLMSIVDHLGLAIGLIKGQSLCFSHVPKSFTTTMGLKDSQMLISWAEEDIKLRKSPLV